MADPDAMQTITHDGVQALADRLFSAGISNGSVDGPKIRADLVAASRTLRALLRHYESSTGRQLQTVILCPGCCDARARHPTKQAHDNVLAWR